MKKNVLMLSLVSLALVGCGTAPVESFKAKAGVEGASGYTVAGDGTMVLSGTSECVKAGSFKEKAPGCFKEEPKPEPVVEKAPEPAPEPEPVVEPVYDTLQLGGKALFGNDSAELTGAGRTALKNLVRQLNTLHSIDEIMVVGHTDSRGDAGYNQSLSERRAMSVKSYLESAGVEGTVSASGMGETQPVASNKTREGRAQNRRVEVHVKGTKRVN